LRPWRQIARELAVENDTKRILELSLELRAAMAAQGMHPDDEGHRPQERDVNAVHRMAIRSRSVR